MALRKAASYSKRMKVAFTRKSNVQSKSYAKAIPPCKIVKFVMGDIGKYNRKEFQYIVELRTKETVNMRDNAIESARQLIHRHLEENFKGAYALIVSCYPHHILRENKMLTGAGADRMQTGMTLSFGVVVGIAARLKANSPVFIVAVNNEKEVAIVREILKKSKAKMPCKMAIVATKVGSAPVEEAAEEM